MAASGLSVWAEVASLLPQTQTGRGTRVALVPANPADWRGLTMSQENRDRKFSNRAPAMAINHVRSKTAMSSPHTWATAAEDPMPHAWFTFEGVPLQ